MGEWEAVLVSFAHANWNYWIAAGGEDKFVPDFDWGEGVTLLRLKIACRWYPRRK
jgi:hypothetical protein